MYIPYHLTTTLISDILPSFVDRGQYNPGHKLACSYLESQRRPARMSQRTSEQSEVRPGRELCIPPCVLSRRHELHPPPSDKPLRIRIQGPLETIRKLLPDVSWHPIAPFPQPGGLELASLTHRALYGGEGRDAGAVVRDEYLAWEVEGRIAQE